MICAVLLAAGRSSRMGTQKLLLPIGNQLLIVRIVDVLLRSPVHKIFVVTGLEGASIRKALSDRNLEFVVNSDPNSDMLESIRCGLQGLPAECRAFLIVLGDQPAISVQLVARLLAELEQRRHGIIVPIWERHRGHPVLISTRHRDELIQYRSERGLRGFLDMHQEEIFQVEVEDPATLADMDTPEDYDRHLKSGLT